MMCFPPLGRAPHGDDGRQEAAVFAEEAVGEHHPGHRGGQHDQGRRIRRTLQQPQGAGLPRRQHLRRHRTGREQAGELTKMHFWGKILNYLNFISQNR